MQVITTHLNADFDCLAAMVAAQKLYPQAKMVFSGSAEKSVQHFLKKEGAPFQPDRFREVDLDQVTRLILVDTQDRKRTGPFQPLFDRPEVEIHIFDHHPEVEHRLRVQHAVIRKRGAATTLLVEELRRREIPLTALESTLLALGIYQDTHSLLSVSTTPEDFEAVGYLVAQGADLNKVGEYVQPRLNPDQREVLNDLIRNLETHNINGVDVTVATASMEHFVEDLAYVVHHVMDLENLPAIFALMRLDRRIYLIGRSRTEEVNVSEAAKVFGGGGHAYAASASIRDLTLQECREKLLEVLADQVHSFYLVRDIMHFPVISVQTKDRLRAVEKTLTRFNLNTLPVLSGNKPVGLITRQIVEKALHHKMAQERTEDFMIREFSVTTPDDYFKSIVPIVIEEKQKLVPVIETETGDLVAVVSRGDLLRVLYGEMLSQGGRQAPLLGGRAGFHKNVKSLMKERLDKKIMDLLEVVSKTGDQENCSVYVVGGFVRDLLLNNRNLDVDIVVEGDGLAVAQRLSQNLGGRVKSHAKFGTSVIILENGMRLDVATARLEFYKHPAALPTVERSSIKADLFRRDFTINSLAVKLNQKHAYTLIDYFNGERDLKDRRIRVLHSLSFIEDPCRIFRAIRFEQRFGFRIGKQTEAFMKSAIKKRMVDQLSGTRLLNELILILNEAKRMACLRRMQAFSLFEVIAPGLLARPESLQILERVEGVLSWSRMVPMHPLAEVWFVYFIGLFFELDSRSFHRAMERLRTPRRIRNRLEKDRVGLENALRLLKERKELKPHQVYDMFSTLSSEAVVYLLARTQSDRINKYATLFYTQYRDSARLFLTGDDLIKMGIPPGPIFQTVFKTLREAKVNGKVKTKKEEKALVEREFLNP